MIAVDTNILVYAHRKDSPLHISAAAAIQRLAEGTAPWAIPWPCLHEFLSVTTNLKIFKPSFLPLKPSNKSKSGWNLQVCVYSMNLQPTGQN